MVGESRMITWDEYGLPGPVMVYDRAVVRDDTYDTFGQFQDRTSAPGSGDGTDLREARTK